MKQTELPLEYLEDAARDLIANDSGWLIDFCSGCCELYVYAASRTCPGDTDCIAGLNPMHGCCHRHSELFEDEAVIEAAEGQYAVDIDPQWAEPETVRLMSAIESGMAKPESDIDAICAALEGFCALAAGLAGGDAA